MWVWARSRVSGPRYDLVGPLSPDFAAIDRWIVSQGIRPIVDHEVPFEEAPVREAIRYVASHRARGKVVITAVAWGEAGAGVCQAVPQVDDSPLPRTTHSPCGRILGTAAGLGLRLRGGARSCIARPSRGYARPGPDQLRVGIGFGYPGALWWESGSGGDDWGGIAGTPAVPVPYMPAETLVPSWRRFTLILGG